MASVTAKGGRTSETETLVLIGGIAFVAYMLKGTFKGLGDGLAGFGQGLAGLGGGAGSLLGSIGGGAGSAIGSVGTVLPFTENQLGSFGDWAAGQVQGGEQNINTLLGGIGNTFDYWVGGTADNLKAAWDWVTPW